jgi:hypothetical protein
MLEGNKMKNPKQDIVMGYARFIRDIFLIIAIPTFIIFGMKLYNKQIEVLNTHINLLKETQYDKALSLIKAQEELHQREKKKLENKIASFESSANNKEEINKVRRQLDRAKIYQELLDEQKKLLKFNKKEFLEYMDRQFDDLPSWDDLRTK